jgi:hypothetical protein
MVKVPSERFKCGRIITPSSGFLVPRLRSILVPFLARWRSRFCLFYWVFLDSRPLFWPFLDGFLNVHLVADLRWIQRRLSHRFRASSWLGLPLELTYMFVRFERSLLRRDSVCRLTRHLNGNIPYCSFPWEYRPLIQSVVAWGIRRSEQRDLAFV